MAPFAWPDGHRAALSLTFDVDAESAILAVDPVYARKLSTMSHQRYGPRVGVPRILRMLERTGVRATFFVPGLTADLHPAMVEAVLAAGHELGHHGYSHVPYHRMTDDEQRRDIDRAFASLARAGGGARPDGFRAPWWELTNSTPGILSEFGLAWDSSLMDDDHPYLLDTGESVLAELPVHWMLDDWEQYAYLPRPPIGVNIESPAKVLDLWTNELDAMRRHGCLFMLTNHPFLSGRPGRVETLRRLIVHALDRGDVAFATCAEVPARVREDPDAVTRPLRPVQVDAAIYPDL